MRKNWCVTGAYRQGAALLVENFGQRKMRRTYLPQRWLALSVFSQHIATQLNNSRKAYQQHTHTSGWFLFWEDSHAAGTDRII